MKKFLYFLLFITVPVLLSARGNDSTEAEIELLKSEMAFVDSVQKAMKYQTGKIKLEGIAELNVPQGFKFLNKEQSNYVITELWGNPPQEGVMGMLFPEQGDPFADSSYAFVITYEAMGYVKDDDADKIDYDEMLKDIQSGEKEENKQRAEQGYSTVHVVGWAQKPFYDKTHKVLHWAKEIKFGAGENGNTLNYEVRILGRKGVLSMNAVASMNELTLVKKDIDKVLAIPSFAQGNTYSEFNPDIDEVAAWSIGGLVAGKILAKAGILALLLKNIKLIILAVAAGGGAIWKFVTGKKKQETQLDV